MSCSCNFKVFSDWQLSSWKTLVLLANYVYVNSELFYSKHKMSLHTWKSEITLLRRENTRHLSFSCITICHVARVFRVECTLVLWYVVCVWYCLLYVLHCLLTLWRPVVHVLSENSHTLEVVGISAPMLLRLIWFICYTYQILLLRNENHTLSGLKTWLHVWASLHLSRSFSSAIILEEIKIRPNLVAMGMVKAQINVLPLCTFCCWRGKKTKQKKR